MFFNPDLRFLNQRQINIAATDNAIKMPITSKYICFVGDVDDDDLAAGI